MEIATFSTATSSSRPWLDTMRLAELQRMAKRKGFSGRRIVPRGLNRRVHERARSIGGTTHARVLVSWIPCDFEHRQASPDDRKSFFTLWGEAMWRAEGRNRVHCLEKSKRKAQRAETEQ